MAEVSLSLHLSVWSELSIKNKQSAESFGNLSHPNRELGSARTYTAYWGHLASSIGLYAPRSNFSSPSSLFPLADRETRAQTLTEILALCRDAAPRRGPHASSPCAAAGSAAP